MLKLTATELPRFMACNGSRLMARNEPFNVDDTARNEGNTVHWLIEQVHKQIHTVDELVNRKAFNGVFITEEMVEHATPFLEAIQGKGDVECHTSHGSKDYQVNGRADHIFYDTDECTLYVSDFKYGWSIVEPKDNWTLISHANGWSEANPHLPIKRVVFRIFQPRPHHSLGKIREWVMDGQMLFNQYIPTLQAALSNPTDQLNTSTHCYKCPALATCPAAQKAGMNAVDVSEFAFNAEVPDTELGFLLDQTERALKVLEQNKKAYSELALHRLKAGKIIPNYIAEKELTNKQWKEGINAETVMVLTGKDLSKKQLITPTQAAKTGLSTEVIDALCERREKGVKLARVNIDVMVKKMFNN